MSNERMVIESLENALFAIKGLQQQIRYQSRRMDILSDQIRMLQGKEPVHEVTIHPEYEEACAEHYAEEERIMEIGRAANAQILAWKAGA